MEAKVEALQAALAEVQSILNIANNAHTPSSQYGTAVASAYQQHPGHVGQTLQQKPTASVPPLSQLQQHQQQQHQPPQQSRPSFSDSHSAIDVKPSLSAAATPNGPSPSRPRITTAMTRENSIEAENHEPYDEAIVNAPMASLFEVTKLRNIRSDPGAHIHRPSSRQTEPDFISQGRISVEEAEALFASFRGTLNAYLWGGIALVHETLDSVRASSTLLTSAILAVTALHAQDEGRSYDVCYPIFLELVSQTMFDRYHTLDDVRALCIGAFWLSDVSWKLSGLAVRIATELNLHQACAKALHDGTSYAQEARLWYFLYVCDHHFSIAYGRPPVINENPTITCHEHFLQRPDCTQADLRLHSQVGIFIILSRVFHTFGPDRSRMIGSDEFETLRRFDADMGYWRDRWKTRLEPNPYISEYPAKGVTLHYHFARLLLFSICLRGLQPSGQASMSPERRQFVNMAIASAAAALDLILNDSDMRRAVIGVPLYLLTTMAYACLFLMKCQSQWKSANLNIHHGDVVALIESTVQLLEDTRSCVRHVAHYLGRGLRGMLEKLKEHNDAERQQLQQMQQQQHQQAFDDKSGSVAMQSANIWAQGQGQAWPDWNSWMPQYTLAPEYNFLGALNSQLPE